MLIDDVKKIDYIMSEGFHTVGEIGAWFRIKMYIAESTKTEHNTASHKICPNCKGSGFYNGGLGQMILCQDCNGTGKLQA